MNDVFPIVVACSRAMLAVPIDEEILRERVNDAHGVLDETQRRAVRRGLRVLESRVLGLWTTGWPERFTRASDARRTRRLRALGRSRVARLRVLYVALHRFCAALYYADPRRHREGFYPGPPTLPGTRESAS
ncbi:MAG: hypothetical protein H6833_11490 [Planctomycetes bacterium]|nr:hypothetical protein [Planctomycetota bacterium]